MKYNTIKSVLRNQVRVGLKVMWTWDKNKKEFTQIYKNYNDGLRIFTPAQLLQELEDVSNS
tara:strand:+ start:263 stop:445 length:183 start_codon:yes stop_codon:yes gene_type:complete